MHLTQADHGMMGSYAIVGAHLPMAAGAAWSAKLRGSGQVAVAFFGDGATNIGAFHEALNLAAVWRLPVVFVCENNRYMEYTAIHTVTSVPNPAADRAAANGMPGVLVDGNDVVAVHDAMAEAVRRARAGDGPTVVEALTYRHFGHSRTDPATYRPVEEVEEWMARDPLLVARRRLLDQGTPEVDLDAAAERATAVVAAAVRAAQAAPPADPADAFTDVWADGGAAWRT
jgi:pyruvate dehydrogenase E1 component alpha subunit